MSKGNSHNPPANTCGPSECGGGDYDPCSASLISADANVDLNADLNVGVGNLVALDLCLSVDADIGVDLF